MAILFFEGWDIWNAAPANDTVYTTKGWSAVTNYVGISALAGRWGGYCLYNVQSGQDTTWRYDFSAKTTAFLGCAAYPYYTGAWGTTVRVLELTDGTSVQVGLGINTSKQLFLYRSTTGTVIATSATTVTAGQWCFLELKATIDPSAGTTTVRKDGVTVADLTLTGQNTRATANSQTTGAQVTVMRSQVSLQYSCYIDDFYCGDTTGSTPVNDLLGEVRVQAIMPTGAGSNTGWTASTGANWSCVDEVNAAPADTDYCSTATPSTVDSFATADITGSPTIFSVAVSVAARKDDVGARTMRTKLKSSATYSNGTTTALNSSYGTLRTQHDTDPSTAAAWTVSGLNAAEVGYEMVA
jgi:hypothetical protein